MKKWIGLAAVSLTAIIGLTLTTKASACALCGHDHGPETNHAPHGGKLEETSTHLLVEVVEESDGLAIFVYDHDLELLPANQVSISAKAITPRRRKMELDLSLEQRSDHFFTQVDFGRRVHRYNLEINLNHDNSTSKVSFIIEP